MVKIELIYITADNSIMQQQLDLAFGATVADALNQSGFLSTHPEISDFSVGIFAKKVALDTPLKPGDRIEIYRPLLLDPKETRRRRAKAKC